MKKSIFLPVLDPRTTHSRGLRPTLVAHIWRAAALLHSSLSKVIGLLGNTMNGAAAAAVRIYNTTTTSLRRLFSLSLSPLSVDRVAFSLLFLFLLYSRSLYIYISRFLSLFFLFRMSFFQSFDSGRATSLRDLLAMIIEFLPACPR